MFAVKEEEEWVASRYPRLFDHASIDKEFVGGDTTITNNIMNLKAQCLLVGLPGPERKT